MRPPTTERRGTRVLTVIGTRPEAIKLAPVILALDGSDRIVSRVCVTSQHPILAGQALEQFAIVPDIELELAGDGSQTLSAVTGRVLERMEPVIVAERPDFVVVEGDTSTVLAAAMAAFHARVPVAHVEAGLRTHDLAHPFPEEANRRIVTTLATLHLAPTEHARRNLLAEGVRSDDVVVTGNPGLDALRIVSADNAGSAPATPGDDRALILVTVHRRESFGSGLDRICRAIAAIARARPDLSIVLPVHPNPAVEGPVVELLGDIENVTLVAPLPYRELIGLLARCTLVLTDSGGLQEEGPALGKPVLVMRETTERPEAVEAGAALLVGRDTERIVGETLALLDDRDRYDAMAVPRPIFGDGYAAPRIVEALLR